MFKGSLSICILILNTCTISAQNTNWQHLDLATDKIFGISADKAYNELLVGKPSIPVIVAIIDYGIDTTHEDLKKSLWTNKNEIYGNGIDDDNNGYIDDVHGWNFIGSENGKEDVTSLASNKKEFYDSLSSGVVAEVYRAGYQENRKKVKEFQAHIVNAQSLLLNLQSKETIVMDIYMKIGKKNPDLSDFNRYQPINEEERLIKEIIIKYLPYYSEFLTYKDKEIDEQIKLIQYHINYGLSLRNSAKLDIQNGNNDVMGAFTLLPNPGPFHGTHLAGIIGAIRNNGIGINGIANNVSIMPLRILSYFRELRDHNLANAIRYAVNNGARIINLSLGRFYTLDKSAVDDAIKYAMEKDVLVIHAAGNDGINLDKNIVYPNPIYLEGDTAKAWIEVGASGPMDDSTLVATFSNYGKNTVDVFAPGVQIYSTIPGSTYISESGTSMAAPIVSGIAALIREYYPTFTALQVKEIIMKSVVKVEHNVIVNDEGHKRVLPFSAVCKSGGIVNVYKALLLANMYR